MPLDGDPEVGCGYGAFKLPKSHPFNGPNGPCAMHDAAYQAHLDGFPHRQLIDADRAFLSYALAIADAQKSLSLRIQAWLYFALITAFRKMFRGDG